MEDDNVDILFVSFTHKDDPDEELLVVGKKLNSGEHFPEIVNAVMGRRARDIYEELITQRKEGE